MSHAKYTSSFPIISLWQILMSPGHGQFGPQGHTCGFREEDFLDFPIVSLWEIDPLGRGQFGSQGYGRHNI